MLSSTGPAAALPEASRHAPPGRSLLRPKLLNMSEPLQSPAPSPTDSLPADLATPRHEVQTRQGVPQAVLYFRAFTALLAVVLCQEHEMVGCVSRCSS